MPKRSDIKKVLLVGSGPIVIGQACEFDYSGTQAAKALREEGVEVVLLNSNPATIMTDPELAHRTYVEPITVEAAEQVIARERPDALLPTMGGQTALNLAKALAEQGILAKYGVRLIGASLEAIDRAEDRLLFKAAMQRIGLETPRSGFARTLDEALALADEIGFPAIVRPSFTLGGTGGGVAYDRAELARICEAGLRASPTSTVLVEESVLGWKEYELEVVRDRADNAIIVCSIENLDPMGVHTGDSITVAPAQTLTDKEYQRMREAALAIVREIGVETGGCNVQFGVDPRNGRLVVIEMNPRVSRSSALASKATGYPIAKVAAKLALGYTLDEVRNDITRDTPASFEPSIDYVVVKIPRFAFEKFPRADRALTTSMRSVGEVMAMGRTFGEAYLKALRSLESGALPLAGPALPEAPEARRAALEDGLRVPRPERPAFVAQALREGWTVERLFELSAIDPWFLQRIAELVALEAEVAKVGGLEALPDALLLRAKRSGFSDAMLAQSLGTTEARVTAHRRLRGLRPAYKRVDTCAGEFEAHTPYLYSTYGEEDELPPSDRPKVMILGSGPIRIGQGIEFDYCCVHASLALREAGFETVMVNCNPETVSTDYDASDRLFFEPLTAEDVLEICAREKPVGVIVQLGGQTPLKLARALERAGVTVLGTKPDDIDRAEDRERFAQLIEKLKLRQPENGAARNAAEALAAAERIGYPVMVRPSYVLGGRAMEVVSSPAELERYLREAVQASPEHPVLVDRFLQDAVEVDLDLVADKTGRAVVGGVLEHVEQAGIHSGDAACVLPPHSLSPDLVARMKEQALRLSAELGVVGLMNVQFAVQAGEVFVLEVNPRASRTVPFVAKATGLPLAKLAALCMAGKTLEELGCTVDPWPRQVAVKESVFPFARFGGVDTLLGPEMRSTGEVMGLATDLAEAFAKSQLAAGVRMPSPKAGAALLSVRDADKAGVAALASRLRALGYSLLATPGTQRHLAEAGIVAEEVARATDAGPNAVERIAKGGVALVINTARSRTDGGFPLRREALVRGVPYYTTLEGARMVVSALEAMARGPLDVGALQDRLRGPKASGAEARVTA